MNEIMQTAIAALEEKAEALKTELAEQRDLTKAIADLDAKKEELIDVIKAMDELGAPHDILAYFINSQGAIWVTKVLAHPHEFNIRLDVYGQGLFRDRQPEVQAGAYRFMVLAIRQDLDPSRIDSQGYYVDDFGTKVKAELLGR